jgi:hypothetical protein
MSISAINGLGVNQVGVMLPYRLGAVAQGKNIPMPDGMAIRRRVSRDFNIDILDTDSRFTFGEVAAIEETLKEIKKRKRSHLIGVKQVVKNKSARVRLEEARHISAGGAYDPDQKRVYLFDSTPEKDISEVLTHEIGHAVNYFNIEFSQFMQFVKDSGYNMKEFRRFFAPGNVLHQFAAKMVDVPKSDWDRLLERFSLNSLVENRDVFGEIVLETRRKPRFPWEQNPLERFAWAYEWFVNKTPKFKALAERAALKGDPSWLADYDFLKDEVFKA